VARIQLNTVKIAPFGGSNVVGYPAHLQRHWWSQAAVCPPSTPRNYINETAANDIRRLGCICRDAGSRGAVAVL
jgi:hypothetical protein